MAKISEFNGNDYVDLTLNENQINKQDMNNMLHFLNNHETVYLYGEGMCGRGFKEYADTCNFKNVKGFVTSDTINTFLSNYEPGREGLILTLKADYYLEILPLIWNKIKIDDILFLKEGSKRIFTQTFSRQYFMNYCWLTLPIAMHCNVNCASCNMFSPLCKPEFYTLENVKKDLEKIKQMGFPFHKINITGGEPFLNPEAIDILKYVRESFPKLAIEIYTNGLLLAKYSDEQLQQLKECNATFQITDYRINNGKLEDVYIKFTEMGIDYRVDSINDEKLFFKKQIDFSKSVAGYEYINCQYYTFAFSVFVYNGKLYKCPITLNSQSINHYSEQKIELTEKDFLDLTYINSTDQLYDFWKSRLPMCGYCPRVTETITWKQSEGKIEEWM